MKKIIVLSMFLLAAMSAPADEPIDSNTVTDGVPRGMAFRHGETESKSPDFYESNAKQNKTLKSNRNHHG
jgi:hypothetical protein